MIGSGRLVKTQIIEQSLLERTKLQMEYHDQTRIVEPTYLFSVGKSFYLIAYCHYRKAWRTFRISRMHRCKMLEDPSEMEPILWHDVDHSAFRNPNAIKLLHKFSTIKNNKKVSPRYPKSKSLHKHHDPIAYCRPIEEQVYKPIIADRNISVENPKPSDGFTPKVPEYTQEKHSDSESFIWVISIVFIIGIWIMLSR